eukprot:GHVL01018422.1.p1 GENE.GHVL01018422.1~~GHVL01018422.1.p1  ORF type:complete len:211 (-),score=32.54 GHVL01018422.1:1040-1672(-)
MRVGSKSMSFIMHKPFHPGNFQNLEKVWAAEEEHKKDLQMQEELLERRRQELQVEELRRAMRLQTDALAGITENSLNDASACSLPAGLVNKRQKKTKSSLQKAQERLDAEQIVVRPKHRENNLFGDHTEVFGSWYDIKEKKWGYRCCMCTNRNKKSCGEKSNATGEVTRNAEQARLDAILKDEKTAKKQKTQKAASGISDVLKLLREENK